MILVASWDRQLKDMEEVPQRYFKMSSSCSEKLNPPKSGISWVSILDIVMTQRAGRWQQWWKQRKPTSLDVMSNTTAGATCDQRLLPWVAQTKVPLYPCRGFYWAVLL